MDWSWVSCIGWWILHHLSHQGSPILSETIPQIPSILQNASHLRVGVLDAEACCADIGLNYAAWSSYVGGKYMTCIISFHSQWGKGFWKDLLVFSRSPNCFLVKTELEWRLSSWWMEGVLSHQVLLPNCPFLLRWATPPGQSQPWLYMRITGGFLFYFFNLKNCFTMLLVSAEQQHASAINTHLPPTSEPPCHPPPSSQPSRPSQSTELMHRGSSKPPAVLAPPTAPKPTNSESLSTIWSGVRPAAGCYFKGFP